MNYVCSRWIHKIATMKTERSSNDKWKYVSLIKWTVKFFFFIFYRRPKNDRWREKKPSQIKMKALVIFQWQIDMAGYFIHIFRTKGHHHHQAERRINSDETANENYLTVACLPARHGGRWNFEVKIMRRWIFWNLK